MAIAEMTQLRVTPDAVRSIYKMTLEQQTKQAMSAVLDLSTDTIKRIRNGRYHLNADCLAAWQETFGAALAQEGGEPPGISASSTSAGTDGATAPVVRFKRGNSPCHRHSVPKAASSAAEPDSQNTSETTRKDDMLLTNEGLRPETKAHFKLPRNPFIDDVQSSDDVFQTASVRYVRAALLDAATNHGFVAVVGESGAGKSTLREDLVERIRAANKDILLIQPYVLGMEGSDKVGKSLKSTQIAEAIAVAIDPHVVMKQNSEARFRQVHEMLKASRAGGRHHLLVIEEAHCLPLATLKHLKRFLELKDGMQRLLGIALIGQPELRARLNGQNAEVREVAQRCEIVTLDPLNTELEGYLQHKFARFDLKLADVFAEDAFDAMRARMIRQPRGGKPTDIVSMAYPLVVNNLVCRAMNAAARAGWPQVDAQVIAGC